MTHVDPVYATSGIGSLGHEDPDAALRTVLEAGLDLPFWPQLPRRGVREHMVAQAALNVGFLVPVDARGAVWRVVSERNAAASGADPDAPFVLPADNVAGLVAFERAALQSPLGRAKGQWIGPVTLLSAVVLDTGRALGSEPRWAAAALVALHRMVVAQAQRLGRAARQVDMWLDEPLLGMAAGDAPLARSAQAWYAELAAACGPRVRLGVHTCAPATPLLFELGVGVVSFDATSPLPRALWPRVAQQLQRGWIAWGLIPAGRDLTGEPAALAAPLLEWPARCGMAPSEFAAHSLVTPACGLASLDAADGAARLRVTVECARVLRRAAAGAQRGDGGGGGG